jgi:DNA repair photolyase
MANENLKPARGAQGNPLNRFMRQALVQAHIEGLDDFESVQPNTQLFFEQARSVVNKINSPDLGIMFSINPYQGCEHGCAYCYARPTHEYYGLGAGLDFESKIMVKQNAPALLEKFLQRPTWKPAPISLSGNTDCYQPLERKLQITRKLLAVLWQYRNPVGVITKNRLVVRDMDILKNMAQHGLVHVYISITTLNEDLRRVLEPRTTTSRMRLQTIQDLSAAGIPVGVMVAPVIPGLNDHEILNIAAAAAQSGAVAMAYTVVRLNGAVAEVFEKWLQRHFPEKFKKVWSQIEALHGGTVYNNRFGSRLRGEGQWADVIRQTASLARRKYFYNRAMPPYNLAAFRAGGSPTLFDNL